MGSGYMISLMSLMKKGWHQYVMGNYTKEE